RPGGRWASGVDAGGGARLEIKRGGLVGHSRRAVGAASRLRRLVDEAVAAYAADLEVQPGKMVIEIKRSASSKGRALAAFMRRAPFAKRRPRVLGGGPAAPGARAGAGPARGGGAAGGGGAAAGPAQAEAATWACASPAAVGAWLARAAGRQPPQA